MSVIALAESDPTAPRLLNLLDPSAPSAKPKRRHALTDKQLAANRRNAQRSTGPRTPAGKLRVSQNATTHGLSKTYRPTDTCHPHSPDPLHNPDYANFLAELETELRPATALQHHLFPMIADLLWRLRRLPHAHQHVLDSLATPTPTTDTDHATDDPSPPSSFSLHPSSLPLAPCQAIAHAFLSGTPSNPLLLLSRYERAMHNSLLRLLKHYHALQKHHPTTPHDPAEPRVPREPAIPYDHPCYTRTKQTHSPSPSPSQLGTDNWELGTPSSPTPACSATKQTHSPTPSPQLGTRNQELGTPSSLTPEPPTPEPSQTKQTHSHPNSQLGTDNWELGTNTSPQPSTIHAPPTPPCVPPPLP